jgi:multiple sugar transport system substrate-binding protein
VLTALQSGAAPDVIDVQHAWVNGYAQNGLVVAGRRRVEGARRLYPGSLDYCTWNGKLWAIPYRIETHAVIYNKGAFKDAGLDPAKPPQTWDELVTAAAKTLSKGKVRFRHHRRRRGRQYDLPVACPSSG